VNNLQIIESCFQENEEKENNWEFDYVVIRDTQGKVVVATYLTTSIQKDDLLHPAAVSEQVEKMRIEEGDPYYLTSKMLSVGSPVSLGNQLYVDLSSPYWKESMESLLNIVEKIQQKNNATSVMIRDFYEMDESLQKVIEDAGFFKMDTFKNNVIETLPTSIDLLSKGVSKNARKHIRKKAIEGLDDFRANIVANPSSEQIDMYYELYSNVKLTKAEINTFKLPKKMFVGLMNSRNWEVIELVHDSTNQVAGYILSNVTNGIFTPTYIGLDYSFQDSNAYSKLLYLTIERAIELGAKKIELGITADFEKQRFGAQSKQMFAYVQSSDHYNREVVDNIFSKMKAFA
ncbi:MAG: GNAT family N-acetyltransferase, partial [Cyclobacteriaceae bacterium]